MSAKLIGRNAWAVAVIAASCGSVSAGCATMFTGSVENVTVSSQPPGARVFVDGAYSGVTPMTLLLKTERDHMVALQHEGYRDTVSPVIREFNPVAALNLFSIVCWVIDMATGALWRFPPNAIYVAMQPLGAPYAPPAIVVPPGLPPPAYEPPPGAPQPPAIPSSPPTSD